MTDSLTPQQRKQAAAFMTRLLRIMGFGILALGVMFFFNIGNIGLLMGNEDPDFLRNLGAMLFLIGVVDIVLLPRLIQKTLDKNQSR